MKRRRAKDLSRYVTPVAARFSTVTQVFMLNRIARLCTFAKMHYNLNAVYITAKCNIRCY